ncbi:MAG: DNA polymerase III subunit gamma/tau [Solirubrobacteraceae bacterium]|nr:DNA polymerase III subunit gamma/tau [Solirubrobacteraceae bacterium]
MPEAPSLYRRHRPRTFSQVVGQEHVVRTLRNAVQQDKVHHAYLFVGSRGTGKTSMAKILAACLNCENGPTAEPCGTCQSCLAIQNATSMDVIEMDAASNNSVDDIRDLRDRVSLAPVSGKSKVYILDEAHMLSSQAWNAFLKTLEEPPPNTIFVLATTEASKVLPTVVDRCHRFDFTRPTVGQLAQVVGRVAGEEHITIGDDAVALVARHATGSFRDALGTLEQMVTYSGTTITTEDVLAVLGIADADLLFGMMDAVASGDAAKTLRGCARLVNTGRDPMSFIRDLEAHARDLLVIQTLGEVPAEMRITTDRDQRIAAQAGRIGRVQCVRLLDLLAEAMRACRDGADARTFLELALVKAAAPEIDPSTKAIAARLERLERAVNSGAAVSVATPEITPPPAAPPPAPAPEEPAGRFQRDPAPPPPPPASVPQANGAAAAAVAPVSHPQVEPEAQPVEEPTPAPPPPAAAPAVGLTLPDLLDVWPAVLDGVRERHALCAGLLSTARPVALEGGVLTVAFPEDQEFLRRKAENADMRACVGEALRAVTGSAPQLSYELRDLVAEAEAAGTPAPVPDTGPEFIEKLMAAFDAEEIRPEDDAPKEP